MTFSQILWSCLSCTLHKRGGNFGSPPFLWEGNDIWMWKSLKDSSCKIIAPQMLTWHCIIAWALQTVHILWKALVRNDCECVLSSWLKSVECSYREETTDTGAVLHYTYNRFGDLKSRRDRCDCAPTEEDAERCFILPFDRLVCTKTPL